jgi:BirA family biotin operon repressor/biotin-[acetyl-CoA-carboxylase] ligase
MDRPDPCDLKPERLEQSLSGSLIGRRVVVLPSTTSTNDAAFELAEKGAEEGLVVFAEEQTGGRGQRGRRWESARGKGLWFSILLQPKLAPAEACRLTDWAARAVADVINDRFVLGAAVKPPNDVYIEQGKVAGVLVELKARPGQAHFAIAGIGINVSQQAQDFPPELRDRAVSLEVATGHSVDRRELAVALLRRLDQTYAAAVGR